MKMGGERVTSSSSRGSGSGSGRKCGRWNPTEEQLKVLSHLFACGLRTPTTPQIQHISNLLSLYGPIESKNVFYWFQNHKARHRLKRPKLPPPLPPPAPEDDDNQVAPLPAERAMETLQLFPLHSLGRSSHVHSHCPQHHTAEPLEPPPLDLRLSFL